jgi:hypothetical protein
MYTDVWLVADYCRRRSNAKRKSSDGQESEKGFKTMRLILQ